jgi:membrane-associated protein
MVPPLTQPARHVSLVGMLEFLTQLVSGSPWTYAVVLGFAALDAVFPLVPSEATAVAAGVLAGAGDLDVALVVGAAAAGALIGDTSAYGVGRSTSRFMSGRLLRGRRAWAERMLDERGGYLLVAARFVPGGRTAVTVTAGLTRMRWTRFIRSAALAAGLWATFAVGLGYLGGRAFEDDPWRGLVAAFSLAAAITVAVESARRYRTSRALTRPSESPRISTYGCSSGFANL